MPDKKSARNLCTRFNQCVLREYEENDGYLGAVVGRYASRIAGGRFVRNGKTYSLACNDGKNHLHGGNRGHDRAIWSALCLEDGVALSRRSPDGEEGYPGNLTATVTYRLTETGALVLDCRAKSDADTALNLTNHTYFDLSAGGDPMGQQLQLFDAQFTEVTQQSLPTGRILPVEDTPLEVRSDLPGIQLYTTNCLTPRQDKGGRVYTPRCALCLETRFYPDPPNHPNFPSPVLRRGAHFHRVTEFHLCWQGTH